MYMMENTDNYSYDLDMDDLLKELYIDNYTFDNEGDMYDMTERMNFEALFIPVLYSVAFVVGILGNGLLLGVLLQSRKTWSVTDTFILHLSISDILLLLTLPISAVQSASETGWTFGDPLCKITGTIFTINFYSGIFLLACISLDRYLSIVHATQMYTCRKPWVVQVSCLVVWLFSLLLSVPDWIFLEVMSDYRRNRAECSRNYSRFDSDSEYSENADTFKLAARGLYHSVGFLVPSAILIICYSCILWKLRCGTQGLQKQRAFRVIIAVVAVFFICWTPYNITLMVDTIQQINNTNSSETNTYLTKALMVTSSVGYLHCSLNPILYAFVGVKFRRQLLNILKSLGCMLKTNVRFESVTRRSSMYSESADTSKSIAI